MLRFRKASYSKISVIGLLFVWLAAMSAVHAIEPDGTDGQAVPSLPPAVDSARFCAVYEDSDSVATHAVTPAFSLVAENAHLALWLNEASLAIRLVNKETAYVWSSDIDDFGDQAINDRWMNYIKSGITIEYVAFRNGSMESRASSESFLANSASSATVTLLPDGFAAEIFFGESGISFTYSVVVEDESIIVAMDSQSVRETADSKLVSVEFYPFLGAVLHGSQNGYFLIPDGGGALVNFTNVYANVAAHYQKRYLGPDVAIGEDEEQGAGVLTFPVYGIAHGVRSDALLVEVRDAYYYAELVMYPAGVLTNYYFISNRYLFRQQYNHIIAGDRQTTVFMPEMSHFTINERITLLSGDRADYAGMAAAYRAGIGVPDAHGNGLSEGIPLSLHVLAAGTGSGLLRNNDIIMTTIAQAREMTEDLQENGVRHIQLIYQSPFAREKTGSERGRYTLRAGLGNPAELSDLAAALKAGGHRLILPAGGENVYSRTAGLDMREDVIRQLNKSYLVSSQRLGAVRYQWYELNASGFAKVLAQDAERFAGMGVDSLGINMHGAQSSFNNKRSISRNEAAALITEALWAARGEGMDLLLDYNSFLPTETLATAQALMWFQPETSLYPYITDTVPFVPLVLRGQMDLFSTWLNNTGAPEEMTLRLIEWGIYPQFVITHRESEALMYATQWANVVSSCYADWKERILDSYHMINGALTPVYGQAMTDHRMLAPGVARSGYENGVSIYVNFTHQRYTDGSVSVDPMAYEVVMP